MNISSQHLKAVFVLFSALAVLSLPLRAAAAVNAPFAIDDYFKVNRINELALSSDGEWIAYRTLRQSLEKDVTEEKIFIIQTKERAAPVYVEAIQNARSFSWIPGTHELVFLAAHDGVIQVQSYDIAAKKLTQRTNSAEGVTAFKFSPSGEELAYLAPSAESANAQAADEEATIYQRLYEGDAGFVIDPDGHHLYNFVDPSSNGSYSEFSPDNIRLWLSAKGRGFEPVSIPGSVRDIHWSSDGTRLSVVYLGEDMPLHAAAARFSSVGVFDLEAQAFKVHATADYNELNNAGTYYSGAEWIPGRNMLHLQRMTREDVFTSRLEWSLVDLDAKAGELLKGKWRPQRRAFNPQFIAASENELYLYTTRRAVTALYALKGDKVERADMIKDVDGAAKFFQFSGDFKSAAFVNENLTTPPEIFVWRAGEGAQQITSLNADVAAKRMPHAREVTWRSKDGTSVQGWLLTPPENSAGGKPWPLVTFVIGGPGPTNNNEFANTFLGSAGIPGYAGGLWSYPFEVYANNGAAVFLPHYRGASSFDPKFSNPSRIDGEPVDDIITGIEHLIDEGVADPQRLSISGQSHGAWLGPLVMTRYRNFVTGSFTEGSASNFFVTHALMAGHINKVTHDRIFLLGDNIYNAVERAVEISPVFHFQGLSTAVLFEAGVRGLGVAMLGHPKAARYANMPTEYVVYPKTGHNIYIPSLQKESATRNFDWMKFWLFGAEDASPEKLDQYARWRKMRDDACAARKAEKKALPVYCAFQ